MSAHNPSLRPRPAATGEGRNPRAESELIGEICSGRRDLFYKLIQPYERMVFAITCSMLNNIEDAEEVAQEAFLKALSALPAFRAEAKFSTWLIQIARNEALMRLRRSRAHLHESLDYGPQDEAGDYYPKDFADWREIPSEALARKELRQTIEMALQSLRPIYREVLILRDVNHLTSAEAAQALEISESLVKTRLLRARLQMREALAPGYDGSWTCESSGYKRVRPW